MRTPSHEKPRCSLWQAYGLQAGTILNIIDFVNLIPTRHHLQYQKVVSPFLRTARLPSQNGFAQRVAADVSVFPVEHMIDVLLSRLAVEPTAEVLFSTYDTV